MPAFFIMKGVKLLNLQFFGGGNSGRGRGGGGRSGGGAAGAGAVIDTQFDTLTDKQISDIIKQARTSQLSSSYHDDITQRLILEANWNGLPEVVSNAEMAKLLNSEDTIKLWRTVNNNGSKTSKQIADEFRTDPTFNTGGWGGQVYGGGIYFTSDRGDSMFYGDNRLSPITMGAVLNNRAKVIHASDLNGPRGSAWLQQHPKAAKALGLLPAGRSTFYKPPSGGSRYDTEETARTALAMAMGYNVVRNDVGLNIGLNMQYYTVLDRSAVTIGTKNFYTRQ